MSHSPAPTANPLPVASPDLRPFDEAQILQIVKFCKDLPDDVLTAKITYVGDGEDEGLPVTMRVVVTKLTNKLVSCAAQSVPNGPVSAETLTFGPGRRALLDYTTQTAINKT